MRVSKMFATVTLVVFSFCFSSASAIISVAPLWAKSTIAGSSDSCFKSITADSSGNIYAVGYIAGTGTYDFGSGVTVVGPCSDNTNFVLVKYDSNKNAQWAKSMITGSSSSDYFSLFLDRSSNSSNILTWYFNISK